MKDNHANLVVEGGGPLVKARQQQLCLEWILVDHLV